MAGKLKVIVDTQDIANQIEKAFTSVNIKPIKIDVKVNTDELDSLEKRIKSLNNGSVNINPQIGGSGSSSNSGSKSGATTSSKKSNGEKERLQQIVDRNLAAIASAQNYSRLSAAQSNGSATANALSAELKQQTALWEKLKSDLKEVDGANGLKNIKNQIDNLSPSFKKALNAADEFSNSFTANQKWAKTAASIEKVQKNVEGFLSKNSALKSNKGLLEEYDQLKALSTTLQSSKDLTQFNAQWAAYTAKVKEAGLAHKSFSDTLKSAFGTISKYFSATQIVTKLTSEIKKAVSDLKEYDTILTEIGKVSGQSNAELGNLLQSSYGTANKYGATVEGYLTAIQEMSRAGFRGTQAEQLAELSTMTQSAGNMTAELSNQYLLATNAAYKYQGSVESLNRVLDGQKLITDNNALSMSDLAEATKLVASQAASSGVEIDQMTALLGTMIATTQQGGNVAGRALKAILMNISQVAV